MKKFNIFISIAVCALGITSCMDPDWDNEVDPNYTIWNDTITERNVISIADLKSKYSSVISNSSFALVKEDIQLKALVICNDEGGNLSQQIIVKDNTGNIIIGVTEDNMCTYTFVGDSILMNLKGLYVGGYGMNGQIGLPSKSASSKAERIGRMSMYEWQTHTKFINKLKSTNATIQAERGVPAAIDFNTVGTDYEKYADVLVYAEGTFNGADGTTKLAEESLADAGNSVNRTLKLTNGGTVTVRTSCYSDFGSMIMPKGKVRVTGILTPYNNSSWQIMMRTENDIIQVN